MVSLDQIGVQGKQASRFLAVSDTKLKNEALASIALQLEVDQRAIIDANRIDCEIAFDQGVPSALIDRLRLDPERLSGIVEGVKSVIELQDPVGSILTEWRLANDLRIEKMRVPIGVIGMIYEARPNVTVDASVLCLKAGNAVILRGSSSAIFSNKALVASMQTALKNTGVPEHAVQLVEETSRESVGGFLRMSKYLDVVIPRGGAGLINRVVQESAVPVIETGAGVCHVFIDCTAEVAMAEEIVLNAKTQRPSVCNSIETVLIHQNWAKDHISNLIQKMIDSGVECRGCNLTCGIHPDVAPATEDDWGTEYLDLVVSIKIVDSVADAIDHISKYGTRHSETIVSEDVESTEKFMREVDAAVVYHNASTRFTDGFMFGFGAEIGISTQKLHARGPMGLPELCSYTYRAYGTGQVRS